MSVLGLDLGTSTCKGVVFTEKGRLLATHQVQYADAVQLSDGTAEIPAEIFWRSAVTVIRTLAEKTHQVDAIQALAVSSHGETLIVTDEAGNTLTNAILSMDRRCTQESLELEQQIGREKIYEITGSMMHPQFPMPKIMWLKKHMPELTAQPVQYYSSADFIHMKLGFARVVDCSIASRFGGFDIHKRQWSEPILKAVGISPESLSRPVSGGTVIGTLSDEMAAQLHLAPGVFLVAGGHDQPCAAVGMGVEDASLIAVSAGSYECASRTTDKPLNDARGMRYGLNSYCHVLKDRYITLAFFVSGMMSQWYIDTFCDEEKRIAAQSGTSVYKQLEDAMGKHPTGVCITPHIFGAMNPEWSESQTAKVSGLRAGLSKADLYRSVLEGCCCELDLNIRVLERLTQPSEQLRMSGGGTRSANWMQMRSDITEKNIEVLEGNVDASCIGAAILAGMGLGIFAGPEDANQKIEHCVRRFTPVEPTKYQAQKEAFLNLHRADLF